MQDTPITKKKKKKELIRFLEVKFTNPMSAKERCYSGTDILLAKSCMIVLQMFRHNIINATATCFAADSSLKPFELHISKVGSHTNIRTFLNWDLMQISTHFISFIKCIVTG